MVEYSIIKDTQISRKTYIYIMYVASFSQVGQEFGQMGHGQDQGQVGLGQGHTMATPAMVMDILDMVMAIVAMGMVTHQDSSMGDLSHIVVLATTADSTT